MQLVKTNHVTAGPKEVHDQSSVPKMWKCSALLCVFSMHRPHTVAPVALCAWHCALRRLSYANLFPPFFVHYAPAGVPTIALCAWHCAVNSFCYASKLSSQAAALRLAPLYRDHPKAHELLIALLLLWYAPLLLCIAFFSDGQLLELCQWVAAWNDRGHPHPSLYDRSQTEDL